jgi:hypothetical protein
MYIFCAFCAVYNLSGFAHRYASMSKTYKKLSNFGQDSLDICDALFFPIFAVTPLRALVGTNTGFSKQFCEVMSWTPLGLQKWHWCQKMRLNRNFCPESLKCRLSQLFAKLWPIYKKSFFARFCASSIFQ